jgi:hypothetical protein
MSLEKNCPLVVVTCQRDLQLLDLQAQSFDRYLVEGSSIIIIVNEKDPTAWNEEFFKNIEKWYKRHHYTIFYKKDFDIDWDLFYKNEPVTGWFRQQILKLAVAEKLSTDFYFVLDTQNFLVNFWTFKARIIDGKLPYRTNQLGWASRAYGDYAGLFGITGSSPENKMSISTPLYMNTLLIKKLLASHKTLKKFSEWFFNYGEDKSEFALYLAWLEFNDGIEKYYYETHNWVHPMLRDSFDFEKDVQLYVESLANIPQHRWSSINFRAWLDMTPKQLSLVINKLRSLGLNPNIKKFREEYREPF